MTGETVSQMLDRRQSEGQHPRPITFDHGTAFQSQALEEWAYRRAVQLDVICPG
jgi:putative transposase